jgi:hypothetical protein
MTCVQCGTALPSGALFCGECGHEVTARRAQASAPGQTRALACGQCGAAMKPEEIFCGECGYVARGVEGTQAAGAGLPATAGAMPLFVSVPSAPAAPGWAPPPRLGPTSVTSAPPVPSAATPPPVPLAPRPVAPRIGSAPVSAPAPALRSLPPVTPTRAAAPRLAGPGLVADPVTGPGIARGSFLVPVDEDSVPAPVPPFTRPVSLLPPEPRAVDRDDDEQSVADGGVSWLAFDDDDEDDDDPVGSAAEPVAPAAVVAPVPLVAAPISSAPISSAPAVPSAPAASAPAMSRMPVPPRPAASVASAPVASAPVASAPVASAPVASAPVDPSSVASAPTERVPVASAPAFSAPVAAHSGAFPPPLVEPVEAPAPAHLPTGPLDLGGPVAPPREAPRPSSSAVPPVPLADVPAPVAPAPTPMPVPPPSAVAPVAPPAPPASVAEAPAAQPWDDGDEEDLESTRITAQRPLGGARFVLQFSTGESVTVFGTGLVGRNPQPQPGEYFDQLVRILDHGKSVSKTHLEFGQEAGVFWVSDRFSGNGTIVREPDVAPRRAEPGRRYRVARGTRIEIGEQFLVLS